MYESNYIVVVSVRGKDPVYHQFTFRHHDVDINTAAERYAIKHYLQDGAKLALFEQCTDNCTGGID